MVNSQIVVNVYFNGQAASYGFLIYILVILDWLKQQCTKIFVKNYNSRSDVFVSFTALGAFTMIYFYSYDKCPSFRVIPTEFGKDFGETIL